MWWLVVSVSTKSIIMDKGPHGSWRSTLITASD